MTDDYTHYEKANKLLRLFRFDDLDRKTGGRTLPEEEKWHRLLIDMLYYFGLAISEERPEKGKQIDVYIDRLIETLRGLEQMPDHDRTIIVRAKELFFTGKRTMLQNDYNLFFGRIRLDLRSAEALDRRTGDGVSQLQTRLAIACERLARYQIQTLSIEIPRQSPADIRRMRLSLRILSAFHQALQSKVPINYFDGFSDRPIAIISDMNDQPNPNLTMLAALNHLKPELLKGFVRNVDGWIRRPGAEAFGREFTSIYSTLFNIRKIIENLRMPPFEINNVNWLMLDRLHNILSAEKAEVLRLVEEKSEARPDEGTRLMESIYGTDYDRIEAHDLVKRLLTVSRLIEPIEDDWALLEILQEIRENIRKRLERVSDDVIGRIELSGNEISAAFPAETEQKKTEPAPPIRGPICETLADMLRLLKARSATRTKIKTLMNGFVAFDASDYQNIADEFGTDRKSAERLIRLLAECFDDTGHFRRSYFQRQIDEFAAFEKTVFDFLWHYLSEIMTREERLGFLNAVQHLIVRLRQPKKSALKLIGTFFSNPGTIRFSDRNALMLTSLLTRTYNQELNIDTEITPEDVLMVSEGVNSEVTEALSRWTEARQKRVFGKVRTINRLLMKALDEKKSKAAEKPAAEMPLAFILALQRELFICLGLVGGETAFSIIRIAVLELGDPESAVYHLEKSSTVRLQLVMLLQTAVRALGRAFEPEDILLLRKIRKREQAFAAFRNTDERYAERVRLAMQWIDKVVGEIEAMSGGIL